MGRTLPSNYTNQAVDDMISKNVKISLSPKREVVVPDDVIFEILTWLPVKSVLRFKCVRKSWDFITQDESFILKLKSRSKCHNIYKETSDGTFQFINYNNGLVLEKSEKTGTYRIRNPGTKQVLQVLDDPKEKRRWKSMVMTFDSSTNNYKLFYVHFKKRTSGPLALGIKMLTVGIDKTWRPLHISLSYDNSGRRIYWRSSIEFTHIISFCEVQVEKTEIIGINLEDESLVKIKLPLGFQTWGEGRFQFQKFLWDEKMSIGFLIKKKLHVWVLENFDKQIWSDKKTISFNFIKDYPNLNNNLEVHRGSNGLLKVNIDGNYLEYDIESKKLYLEKAPFDRTPTLLSLKGMHSEPVKKPNMLIRCFQKIRGLLCIQT